MEVGESVVGLSKGSETPRGHIWHYKCIIIIIRSLFNVGNMLISDNNKIANTFNHYFVNVGQILASKIPDQTGSPLQYVKGIIQIHFSWSLF